MAAIKWTQSALDDLEAIVRFIAKDSAFYARRVGSEILRVTRQLQKMPHMGRMVPELGRENIREVICGSYRVIYQIENTDCSIVAVIHSSRDILRIYPRP